MCTVGAERPPPAREANELDARERVGRRFPEEVGESTRREEEVEKKGGRGVLEADESAGVWTSEPDSVAGEGDETKGGVGGSSSSSS